MNPVFIFLVLLGAFILWFLLSGLYRFIGGITTHIYKNAKDAINEEPKKNKKKRTEMFKWEKVLLEVLLQQSLLWFVY